MTLHSIFVLLFATTLRLINAQDAAATTATEMPSTASSTTPQYIDNGQFQAAVLNSTNYYRYEHAAPGVSWNDSLAQYASNYLDSSDCAFEHSNGPDGENLAHGYADPTAAIEAWGNERAEYDWSNPTFSEATGHFTQLVWKATRTVGCDRRWCGADMGWLVACEYDPRGNMMDEFAQQVHEQINGSRSQSGSDWCPQGAACDAGANLKMPWFLQRSKSGSGAVLLMAVLGLWAWI